MCHSPPVRGCQELIYLDEKVGGVRNCREQLGSGESLMVVCLERNFLFLLDATLLANQFLNAVDYGIRKKTLVGLVHDGAVRGGGRLGKMHSRNDGQSGNIPVECCKHTLQIGLLLGTHRACKVLVHECRGEGLPDLACHLGCAFWTKDEGDVPTRDRAERVNYEGRGQARHRDDRRRPCLDARNCANRDVHCLTALLGGHNDVGISATSLPLLLRWRRGLRRVRSVRAPLPPLREHGCQFVNYGLRHQVCHHVEQGRMHLAQDQLSGGLDVQGECSRRVKRGAQLLQNPERNSGQVHAGLPRASVRMKVAVQLQP
mmetsp:Transcript_14542/g.36926  ORF Transcript_14542/g.36926 Transcript_14542/m.36926 type:complete len:316 (-) Transcript_14542:294-1241(-)